MNSTSNANATPIAAREFRGANDNELVAVAMYAPIRDPSGETNNYCCEITVQRGDTKDSLQAWGVDSLQALVCGFSALRHSLRSELRSLRWLSGAGELGLPILINVEDPDFEALVEHLIGAEHCRQLLAAKRKKSDE